MNDTCVSQIERQWQALTVSSNELFLNGGFQKAIAGYRDALSKAERLNDHIPDCLRLKIPFIQVYIISCNNLANTFEQLDNKDEAENMLKRAIYYLMHLTENKTLNLNEIQWEIKNATLTYTVFAEKNRLDKNKQEVLLIELRRQLSDNNLIKTE